MDNIIAIIKNIINKITAKEITNVPKAIRAIYANDVFGNKRIDRKILKFYSLAI